MDVRQPKGPEPGKLDRGDLRGYWEGAVRQSEGYKRRVTGKKRKECVLVEFYRMQMLDPSQLKGCQVSEGQDRTTVTTVKGEVTQIGGWRSVPAKHVIWEIHVRIFDKPPAWICAEAEAFEEGQGVCKIFEVGQGDPEYMVYWFFEFGD